MTPAEHLRAAAQLARETAEAATPGPWYANPGGYVEIAPFGEGDEFNAVADTWNQVSGANAAHIALWSPPVALAVAAWLETEAKAFDDYMDRQLDPERRFGSIWLATAQERHEHALAVADALLQTQPVKP